MPEINIKVVQLYKTIVKKRPPLLIEKQTDCKNLLVVNRLVIKNIVGSTKTKYLAKLFLKPNIILSGNRFK